MTFPTIQQLLSPRLWDALSLRVETALACVLFGFAVGVASGASATEPAEGVRLRIAWGGGTPIRWGGRISLSEGELTGLKLLGRERDTPGSIWIEDREVRFVAPRPRGFDGFDITASAQSNSILRIEFRTAGDEPPTVEEIKLSDLMVRQHRSSLDENGNSLLVHRAQDDALRLEIDLEDLIFSPGEQFAFTVQPVITAVESGASFDLAVELLAGRRGDLVWSKTERVTLSGQGTAEVPMQIPLPDRAGVYSVRLVALTPPGNRLQFWDGKGNEQLAQRSFQVVVLDAERSVRTFATDWHTLVEIDPANPRWWNRLPDWARLNRWTVGGKGSMTGAPFRTSTWQGTKLAEIAASAESTPSWQAYPLPNAQPGRPHVVEIDLPGDEPQQIALRIFEPDEAGRLVAVGPGGGVIVDAWPPQEKPTVATYRYLFWPRTDSPVLVVQNANQSRTGKYGKIRLRIARDVADSSIPITISADERMVAAYFSWEGLIERMGASRFEQRGRAATDDWVTFYETAERLADYLELSGYNGAVVNVFADGGSACHSGQYPTTPLLNSSLVVTGMNDLPQTDPLELLLRVFERRGLRLTPTLRFTSALPGVDEQLQQSSFDTKPSPVWTDQAGRQRLAIRVEDRTGPPHYDIAHPAVSGKVRAVIDSVIERYGSHAAFSGLGIELTADSYLPPPPSRYGLTRGSLAQLATQTNATEADLNSWFKHPRVAVEDPAVRRQWNATRAAPATKFYQSIAASLQEGRPEASLLLLTDELLESREYASALRP
ncbi:MAG: hypothetical protein ACR2NU_09615, partial [Aeoliella sp.]